MKNKINMISNGTLSFQDYKIIIDKGFLYAKNKIPDESIQPASIDLRLNKITKNHPEENATKSRKKNHKIEMFISKIEQSLDFHVTPGE